MHVVTIGNFDGGHEGHRALVAGARALADEGGAAGVVTAVTFDPLPRLLLRPEGPVELLQTLEARRATLREFGADQVLALQTDRALLATSPEVFIDDLRAQLAKHGTVGCFVEGGDFRFGAGREGTIASLRAHGERAGFKVEVVPEVRVRLAAGTEVEARSSVVRRLLEEGRVDDAATVLGRRYTLEGTVEKGDQRGRNLGFPTANLAVGTFVLPADGIYAGVAVLPDGVRRLAAVSIGTKPTFGNRERVLEAHILDWNGPVDEYGWVIKVELARSLRGQVNYDGVEPLVAQIKRDCEAVRALEEDMELMG